MSEFEAKVVIVTGGAKGIGRGISEAFAREGARVICVDLDEAAGNDLVAQSALWPGEIRFEQRDVALAETATALVETATQTWGGVDILVNNAGIQPLESYVPAHELPETLWDRIIDVNLKSAFLLSRTCVPVMMERGGGAIINIASVQGLQSMQGVAAYAASKGGMIMLTRQLALEYARNNIRVLAVNPGTVDTPLVADAMAARGGDMNVIRTEFAEAHPLGRIGTPADIANVVLFLASSKASFMTGEYVCVDGGMMARGAWA